MSKDSEFTKLHDLLASKVGEDGRFKEGVGFLKELTQDEVEITLLMLKGLKDAEIGDRLHIASAAVGKRLITVLSKIGYSGKTRTAIILYIADVLL